MQLDVLFRVMAGNETFLFIVNSDEGRYYFPHLKILVVVILFVAFCLCYGFPVVYAEYISDWRHSRVTKDDIFHIRVLGNLHQNGTSSETETKRSSPSFRRRTMALMTAPFATNSAGEHTHRVDSDSKALLARSCPTEKAGMEMNLDRLIGWATLYWDIPVMIVLPFMAKHVWPETLKVPFHTAGSILYIGGDLNLTTLRISFVSICASILVFIKLANIVILRKGHKKMPKLALANAITSRVFYGALYTVLIFQAGTLLGKYKGCEKGIGTWASASCEIADVKHTNGTTGLRIDKGEMNVPVIILCVAVATWAFVGAMHYTTVLKNQMSPSFMWLPMFEAVRYIVKTIISGAGSVFSSSPYVIMPTYLVCYSLLTALTYSQQPCQGQCRRANNLRCTGFALGAWVSFCGLVCVIFDIGEAVESTASIAASYATLFLGGTIVGTVAWALNDTRARKVAIPDKPWDKLLSDEHTPYVHKVVADAILLLAEASSGKAPVSITLIDTLNRIIKAKGRDPFVRLRAASAYLLFCGAERKLNDTVLEFSNEMLKQNRVFRETLRSTLNLNTWGGFKRKSCHERFMNAMYKRICRPFQPKQVFIANRKGRSERRVSQSGRYIRTEERTMKQGRVDECLNLTLDAFVSKSVPESIKSRIAKSFLIMVANHDENSFFTINLEQPKCIHALNAVHCYSLIGKGNLTEKAAILSLKAISNFAQDCIANIVESRNLDTCEFAKYFVDDAFHVGYRPSLRCDVLGFLVDSLMKFVQKRDTRNVSHAKSHLKRTGSSKVVPNSTFYLTSTNQILLISLHRLWRLEIEHEAHFFQLRDFMMKAVENRKSVKFKKKGVRRKSLDKDDLRGSISGVQIQDLYLRATAWNKTFVFLARCAFSDDISIHGAAFDLILKMDKSLDNDWEFNPALGLGFKFAIKMLPQLRRRMLDPLNCIATFIEFESKQQRASILGTGGFRALSSSNLVGSGKGRSITGSLKQLRDSKLEVAIDALVSIMSLRSISQCVDKKGTVYEWESRLVRHLFIFALNAIGRKAMRRCMQHWENIEGKSHDSSAHRPIKSISVGRFPINWKKECEHISTLYSSTGSEFANIAFQSSSDILRLLNEVHENNANLESQTSVTGSGFEETKD